MDSVEPERETGLVLLLALRALVKRSRNTTRNAFPAVELRRAVELEPERAVEQAGLPAE